jgi:hypothetical protein
MDIDGSALLGVRQAGGRRAQGIHFLKLQSGARTWSQSILSAL